VRQTNLACVERFASPNDSRAQRSLHARLPAAQAVELVRALRDQLRCMTTHLARLERQDVTGGEGRAVAAFATGAPDRRAQLGGHLVGSTDLVTPNRNSHLETVS
jgi:hypothetical protein